MIDPTLEKEIRRLLEKEISAEACEKFLIDLKTTMKSLELASFKIVNIVCWDKGHFGTGAGYRSQSEYLLVFSKGLPNTFNLRNVGNVIKCSRAKEAIHPHQKPTELLKILVEGGINQFQVG